MRNRQAINKLHHPSSFRLALMLLAVILLTACTPPQVESTPIPISETPTETSTTTRTATNTASPVPTRTLTPTATPVPDCANQAGSLQRIELDTEFLYDPIKFTVYLPPCYDQYPEQDYPLLVLFHGLYYQDDQWVNIGAVEIANRLIISGEIPPFIMLLPYDPTSKDPSGSVFDEIFLQDMLPYMESTYRLRSGNDFRAVAGLSRGAGWAIHFGFKYPKRFGIIGAHSPIIFREDSILITKWLDILPSFKMPDIFMDIGDDDPNMESFELLKQFFDQRSVPYETMSAPGYHSQQYWQSQVETYICWITSKW